MYITSFSLPASHRRGRLARLVHERDEAPLSLFPIQRQTQAVRGDHHGKCHACGDRCCFIHIMGSHVSGQGELRGLNDGHISEAYILSVSLLDLAKLGEFQFVAYPVSLEPGHQIILRLTVRNIEQTRVTWVVEEGRL